MRKDYTLIRGGKKPELAFQAATGMIGRQS